MVYNSFNYTYASRSKRSRTMRVIHTVFQMVTRKKNGALDVNGERRLR